MASAPNSTVGNRPTGITSGNAFIVPWAKVPYKLDGVYFHARTIARRRQHIHLRVRRFAAEPMAPNDIQATFFNGKPFTASTTSGTQFKMIFTPDGKMTREPRGKSGKKNSGTWKLDSQGFCTIWKQAEANCYTIVPSGKNKWSVQKGSTALAVWTK